MTLFILSLSKYLKIFLLLVKLLLSSIRRDALGVSLRFFSVFIFFLMWLLLELTFWKHTKVI